MHRIPQIVFVVSLILLCWLGMMAVHELGHVLGALLTGSTVTRVVLNPLTISRTEISPNRSPAFVTWAGPVAGVLLPLALLRVRRSGMWHATARFFAGFCLIANGVYISVGSLDGIGDAGDMLRTGTPVWLMWMFGAVTVIPGLLLWHRTGSLRTFLSNPSCVTDRLACTTVAILLVVFILEFLLSPP